MTPPNSTALSNTLDDFAKISRLCSLCSRMCRHSCPTHLVTRSDACSPVGRALIIELYRGGKSALTEAAVDRLYQCNLCGACKAWCMPRHELPRIIELSRERVVAEHRAPAGTLELDKNTSEFFNVYGEPHDERFAQLQSILKNQTSTAEIAYFVGCTTAYRHPEIASATHTVLARLGIDFTFLNGEKNEVCCGSPLIRAGFIESAKSLAEQNVKAIKESGAKTILTTCPGCARALKLDYPQLGIHLPKKVKVLHMVEFLVKQSEQLAPLIKSPLQTKQTGSILTMTYHDPCHLGRELGIYEPPRQLLKLIPGADLMEFTHNREYADCCGGGGALPKTFPALAEEITRTRLADTPSASNSYLVSACPNCKLHFTETQNQVKETDLKILDLMEILAQVLKERR
ncbi:MAG: (Fe-S)-binding protein [Candidatus Hermodarchaeota archaeon]|nr:(Fe-S)-binding protein [Candidatus Hermodarchaeota archaeon]